MNTKKEDIIIIGCPRSGKTTLTNMLMKNDNSYHNISLDSLTMAIKKSMPESGIKEDSNKNREQILNTIFKTLVKSNQISDEIEI